MCRMCILVNCFVCKYEKNCNKNLILFAGADLRIIFALFFKYFS